MAVDGRFTKNSQHISTTLLRRMLVELMEHRPDVCVRFRLLGQMWYEQFCRVVGVSETHASLRDESSGDMVNALINNVVQIELDRRFQQYEPYTHYDVSLF